MQWGRLQETAATLDLQLEFCENVQRKLKISSLLLPRSLARMAGPEEVSRAEWAERGGEDSIERDVTQLHLGYTQLCRSGQLPGSR